MNELESHLVGSNATILETLGKMNKIAGGMPLVLFVVSPDGRVLGSVTDGDIRRNLVAGATLDSRIDGVMNKKFHYLLDKRDYKKIGEFKALNLRLIPHVSPDGKLLGILNLNAKRTCLPVDAVIMAGGRGIRLQPYTNDIPKPMLPLRDKPIIAHNIERLASYGVENFHISVNHLKGQIIDYLTDRYADLNIDFIEEDAPLGTIGSVRLAKEFRNDDILVINADILTNIDFEDFFAKYKESFADMSVAAFTMKVDIPYAVLETSGNMIRGFTEKPTYNYYSNAGIYLFGRKLVDSIPPDSPYNATDMIERLVENGGKVSYFPIVGYWLDIGTAQNYSKAKNDINYIKF